MKSTVRKSSIVMGMRFPILWSSESTTRWFRRIPHRPILALDSMVDTMHPLLLAGALFFPVRKIRWVFVVYRPDANVFISTICKPFFGYDSFWNNNIILIFKRASVKTVFHEFQQYVDTKMIVSDTKKGKNGIENQK